MRRVLDEQTYLDFNPETSLKVVRDYRAKYAWIDECLEANPTILWLVHEDLEALSERALDAGAEAAWSVHRVLRVRPAWRSAEAETFLGASERAVRRRWDTRPRSPRR